MYVFDSNAIIAEALREKSGQELLQAYQKVCDYLRGKEFIPKVHWIDNEALETLKVYDQTRNIGFQLAPLHMHRRNAVERVICN